MEIDFQSLLEDINKFMEESTSTDKVVSPKIKAPIDITKSSPGDRVVATALQHIEDQNVKGAHCWDWVDKIYKMANVKRQGIYHDISYVGKDCGNHKASQGLVNGLQPGDWLYINNKNKYDTNGNHSVIFIKWIAPGKVAQIASCWGAGQPGRLHTNDFDKSPVVHIERAI